MTLPSVPLPRRTLELNGQTVVLRGLSRAEVMAIKAHQDDLEECEILILMGGLSESREAIVNWRNESQPYAVDTLVGAIAQLSGFETTAKGKAAKASSVRKKSTNGHSSTKS